MAIHSHQRYKQVYASGGNTEITLNDIALANQLAHEVLGRSLDELPPQTRRVLGLIESLVAEKMQQHALQRTDVRFTRRELRQQCGMSDAVLRVHLERLDFGAGPANRHNSKVLDLGRERFASLPARHRSRYMASSIR